MPLWSFTMFNFLKKFKSAHRIHKQLARYGVDPKYTYEVVRGFNFSSLDDISSEATNVEYTLMCLVEVLKVKEEEPNINIKHITWLSEWIEILLTDKHSIRKEFLELIDTELHVNEEPGFTSCNKNNNGDEEVMQGDELLQVANYRSTHCWNCFQTLNSTENSQCNICGWLICHKCNSCSSDCGCSNNQLEQSCTHSQPNRSESPTNNRLEYQLLVKANYLFNGFAERVNLRQKFTTFDNALLKQVFKEDTINLEKIYKEQIFGGLSPDSANLIMKNLSKNHHDWIIEQLALESKKSDNNYVDEFSCYEEHDDYEEYEDVTSGLEESK